MENVAPCPGDDSTAAAPPWASATARTIASPSPEPSLAGSRRTPGSKMRTWSSTGMPPPESVTVTITVPAVRACFNEYVALRPGSRHGVLDQVVHSLSQPDPVALHVREIAVQLRADSRSAEGGAQGRVSDDVRDVDLLEAERAEISVREYPLDTATRCKREVDERPERGAVEPTDPDRADDRGERSCGAAHLVHHECQLLGLIRRRHVVRAAMRSSAQAAVSLSIGSCPEACV